MWILLTTFAFSRIRISDKTDYPLPFSTPTNQPGPWLPGRDYLEDNPKRKLLLKICLRFTFPRLDRGAMDQVDLVGYTLVTLW